MKVSVGGGNPVSVASKQRAAQGIAVDGSNVYWTNWGDGTVMKVPTP